MPLLTATPTNKTSTKPKASAAPVSEPFGQTGVLRYAMPMLSLGSLMFACFCGVMWIRSYDTNDALARRVDNTITQIDSITGGIIVHRIRIALFSIVSE